MRICFIADAVSIHTQRWVNYFAERGHEVHLISSRFTTEYEGYDARIIKHPLIRLLPRIWKVSGYLSGLLWLFQISRLVRRIKPDIIDAHYISINAYLGIISGFHPLILSAWGSDILIVPKRNMLWRCITKYALKKADLIVCFSYTLKEEVVSMGISPSKIRVVLIGVDTAEFNPKHRDENLRQVLNIGDLQPVVISTRVLEPIYNVKTLIMAAVMVLRDVPQAKFIIVGKGPEKIYLETLSQSLGISDSVRFVGWIQHNELPSYLASADIYVSTSYSDGASNSLFEAMACGLAPVVTDIPANQPWIRDKENGLLFPVGDYQKLTEKIINLINSQELRLKFGSRNREIVVNEAEYSMHMDNAERNYLQLIEK